MASPVAFLNGRFLSQAKAHLALHDAGIVFGATATEFVRTFRHELFRLGEHLERFATTCSLAKIPQHMSLGDLETAAVTLVERNRKGLTPERELALVMIATPGPVGFYVGQAADGPPTLVMHTMPLAFGRYASWFREGARLVTPATRQIPAACLDPAMKHRSRMHWWLAKEEIGTVDRGASPLLLDLNGCVTESAAANFLIVRKRTVCSPPADTILKGVSLGITRGLCQALGIPFKERRLKVADCLRADEAMITGTAFCLAGVASLNRHPFTWPGPITRALTRAWGEQVGLDYHRQILADR